MNMIYDDLIYACKDGGIVITDHKMGKSEITIPDTIEDLPIVAIGKKAFLSDKILKRITVGRNVSKVSEWAFAKCDKLTEVIFETDKVTFEKGVFEADDNLKLISVGKDCLEDAGSLLALCPNVMKAEYLLNSNEGFLGTWFNKWDMKLKDILERADDEGYHLYVLCGEEDLHYDYDKYVEYVREKKAGLSINRLLYREALASDLEHQLIDYLLDNESAIDYLINQHGDEIKYYELLISCGCICANNIEHVLYKLGDRHAKMKAYVIKRVSEMTEDRKDDFYDSLLI